MPRYPRNYNQTDFFHVMTQGIEKKSIFENPEDAKFYISFMHKIKDSYNVDIIAYCTMSNHSHLLLKVDKISCLSNFMHVLNTTYAKYYNCKYKRVGYVFRDRFKAQGIYSERQLYNCLNYIFENPVKAGICNNPKEYPFSNYKKIDISYIDDNMVFIDVDEECEKNYTKAIEDFFIKNNIKLEELKDDKALLKEFIILLKDNYHLSFRKISNLIKYSKDKIRKIYIE